MIAESYDPRAFKFKPKAMAAAPQQFGKSSLALSPAVGVSETDARFMAAQLQHRVANAARESILNAGQSLKSYVAQFGGVPGMTYERLVRVQRGDTLMQLADLMAWASRFEAVRELLAEPTTWPNLTPSPIVGVGPGHDF